MACNIVVISDDEDEIGAAVVKRKSNTNHSYNMDDGTDKSNGKKNEVGDDGWDRAFGQWKARKSENGRGWDSCNMGNVGKNDTGGTMADAINLICDDQSSSPTILNAIDGNSDHGAGENEGGRDSGNKGEDDGRNSFRNCGGWESAVNSGKSGNSDDWGWGAPLQKVVVQNGVGSWFRWFKI